MHPGSLVHMGWVGGARGRPLSVRVDLPGDGSCHGVVLVLPAMGREASISYRTSRAMAVKAAERGFITYTVALTGEGDTGGTLGDEPHRTWEQDVRCVADQLRAEHPDLPLHLVGLRLGAVFVDSIPCRANEMRVLWEPLSGRQFVRRQQAMRSISVNVAVGDAGIETLGRLLTIAQAGSISQLTYHKEGLSASVGARRIVRSGDDGVGAQRIAEVSPHFAAIPYKAIAEVLASLPIVPSRAVPLSRLSEVAWPPELLGGLERYVSIGPKQLPGVLTEPAGAVRRARGIRGAVMFTGMGVEPRMGPGELWVDLARELALRGIMSLRADRYLTGDALDVNSPMEPRPYTNQALEDLEASAEFIRRSCSAPIVGVGLCSGAWGFMVSSRRVRPDAVVAVNNLAWRRDPQAYDEAFYEREYSRDSAVSSSEIEHVFSQGKSSPNPLLHQCWRAGKRSLGRQFPALLALRRGTRRDGCVEEVLAELPGGTRVTLLFGSKEFGRYLLLGGESASRRARKRGVSLTIHNSGIDDHSLLSYEGRKVMTCEILKAIESALPGQGSRFSTVDGGCSRGPMPCSQ